MSEKWMPLSLPSKCLAYPGVDSTKLQIRALKGKDEKLISEMSGDNFEKKFATLLKSVVQGIDIDKLTLGDRLYIAVWEAMSSYSAIFSLKSQCEHCFLSSEYSVDLAKLENIELPDSYKQPYEVTLPVSGNVVKLRLLNVYDNIKLDEMSKAGQNVWLYRYAFALEMEGKNVVEKVEVLENLDTKDLAVIRAFHEKFFHGPKMEYAYECPKCGGTGVMPVPFRIEMLFPYGEALKRDFGGSV